MATKCDGCKAPAPKSAENDKLYICEKCCDWASQEVNRQCGFEVFKVTINRKCGFEVKQ